MKTEFQTKESLMNNLTLEGRTELIEASLRIGINLDHYIESLIFVDKTGTYWVDSDLVKERKDLYTQNDSKINKSEQLKI